MATLYFMLIAKIGLYTDFRQVSTKVAVYKESNICDNMAYNLTRFFKGRGVIYFCDYRE